MKKLFHPTAVMIISLFFLSCANTKKQSTSNTDISAKWIDKNLQDAATQYKYFITKIPEGVMPRSFTKDTLRTATSDNWTAGFYPGTLLYLYENTKDEVLFTETLKKIKLMEKEQYNKGTHDLGFMMYCSYGNLNRITPNEEYKKILINSARSLASRFNPTVGCIRSWGKSNDTSMFRVIIDNMMNLELLFWAAKETGDRSLYNIAIKHANTTMKNHFRQDNSTYHVVVYNPQTGNVMKKETAQGAANESAWARGQSWGLYGYTLMYRETKDKKYLDQAQRIADFILSHPNLPANKIPYWDFNAPGIPNTYRDASSSAILASALIELAGYSDPTLAKKYLSTVEIILRTLSSSEYKARIGENGGFILKHSVAHLPRNSEVDSPLPYADYYYLEALMRYKKYFKL
ncbi:MAG TPA: glycoside hydrolase family 88 protein [Chitinophagaceae bacterium]|nr:glycoside hydrolase family 88 protein [Chitinophagaceae bacterium]